jgi:hypothetical protein
MGLGKRVYLALERDDICARFWDRLGCNDRLEIVLQDKTGRAASRSA